MVGNVVRRSDHLSVNRCSHFCYSWRIFVIEIIWILGASLMKTLLTFCASETALVCEA